MDPNQFLQRSPPIWLQRGEEAHEFIRDLERELGLEHEEIPAAEAAAHAQLPDGDHVLEEARPPSVWEVVLALITYKPAEGVSWEEWGEKFQKETVAIIEDKLAASANTHRDKLEKRKEKLAKLSQKLSELAKRMAQPGSSSAAAREGARAVSDKDVTQLEKIIDELDGITRCVDRASLEPLRGISTVVGLVKDKMRTTLEQQQPNYIPVSNVIGVLFP